MSCLSVLRPCSIALLCSASLLAQQFPSEQQRLISVAKLWVTVKYFHPSIASKSIDWDKALVDALPAIRRAASETDFSTALDSLLAPLSDPATKTYRGNGEEIGSSLSSGVQRSWMHHGLPSALPSASVFYQGFVIKPFVSPRSLIVLTPNLGVRLNLTDEPSNSSVAPNPIPDSDYADTPYPSTELRILSAFRIWGAIHTFYAYKDLMDEDWDAVFADALPKFIAAKDARAYHLAVAEMVSRLSDSNCTVQSHELDRYFGEASPGIIIRLIEKRPVVAQILDTSATLAGLKIGDIITAVDGEKLSDRIKREANYISISTAQALTASVVTRLLNGSADSAAALTTSDPEGRPRTVTLKRTVLSRESKAPANPGPPVRILAANIGYVNLTQLAPAQVTAMFEKLQNTTAIIFDARGPIAPMASQIASCLARQRDVTTAIVTGPLSLEPDLPKPGLSTTTSSYFAMESLEKDNCRTPYKGKTVMLIDERTIGNAEHLGLALEAANNTEFLGTPSAGADSAVTQFTAPGGILIRFSGTDIRRANAGPIQRMGLQPSLALAPKIAAIRAGRDVVLEKAIEYLRPPATQASLHRLPEIRLASTQP